MRKSISNKAFTVAELIMSLVVMSLLATAVAGLSIALTDAYEHGKNFQQDMQIARNSLRNISNLIKKSNLVCGASNTSLVIWTRDSNSDGQINFVELCYIELESSTGKIMQYYLDSSEQLEPFFTDQAVSLQTANDIELIRENVKSMPLIKSFPIARNVRSLAFSFDASPPLSQLFQMKIKVASDESSPVVLRSCSSIRSDWITFVGTVDGKWVLAGGGI